MAHKPSSSAPFPSEPSESSPLLHDHPDPPTQKANYSRPPLRRAATSILPQTHSPRAIVLLLACTLFIVSLGAYMIPVPLTRAIEDVICHNYYESIALNGTDSLGQGKSWNGNGRGLVGFGRGDEIDEKLCKSDDVQEELAIVKGVLSWTTTIPGKLLLGRWVYGQVKRKIMCILAGIT